MKYSELRKQLATAKKELNDSVHFLEIKREENTRLKEAIYLHEKAVSDLENRLSIESSKTIMFKESSEMYYDILMKEYDKNMYYSGSLIASIVVIITLMVLLIKG